MLDHGSAYHGTVIQSARTPDAKGWAVVVENTDPSPVTVGAYVICLSSAPTGAKVTERSHTITVAGGQIGAASAACQSGELAVGGGFAGQQLQITALGTSGDAGWLATAVNLTASDAPLTAYVECLKAAGAYLRPPADQGGHGVSVQPLTANRDALVCPIGTFVAGGGFSVSPGIATVYQSQPNYYFEAYDYQDWTVNSYNASGTVQVLLASVVCLQFNAGSTPVPALTPTLDAVTQAYMHILLTDYPPFVDAEQAEYDQCGKVLASRPLAPCRPLEVTAMTAAQTLLSHLITTPPPAAWHAQDAALKQAVQEALAYNMNRIQAIDTNNAVQFQLTRSDGNAAASLLCTTILDLDYGPPPISPSILVPAYAMDPQSPGCLPA
jgi:hypothetical protein